MLSVRNVWGTQLLCTLVNFNRNSFGDWSWTTLCAFDDSGCHLFMAHVKVIEQPLHLWWVSLLIVRCWRTKFHRYVVKLQIAVILWRILYMLEQCSEARNTCYNTASPLHWSYIFRKILAILGVARFHFCWLFGNALSLNDFTYSSAHLCY